MVSWLLPALACTPLGAWLYYHPSVTVARVRVDARAEGKLPVVIALDMQNPNDYTISATRVELELVLDSLPIGRVKKDEKLVVPGAGTARLALPLEPDRRASPARLAAFRSGVHRFSVRGRATIATPFGKQDIPFAQEGDLVFGGEPASPASARPDPNASP